jgi:nitrite reductase/ring-hydroxylating ferredoxin subunit
VGDLQAVSGAPAIIARDPGGLYAMTSTCTHEGCDMLREGSVSRDGVYCSCHGSTFDVNGKAVSGPAHGTLAHFAVSVDRQGLITVHGGTSVPAETRTAVA